MQSAVLACDGLHLLRLLIMLGPACAAAKPGLLQDATLQVPIRPFSPPMPSSPGSHVFLSTVLRT